MVAVDATRRNLSQGGVCYMLIQILQSIGQLLTSGARPVAGRLGPRFPRIVEDLGFHRCINPLLAAGWDDLHL